MYCRVLYCPDDGGSTYLWDVGRQLFYTAVHPRRQIGGKNLIEDSCEHGTDNETSGPETNGHLFDQLSNSAFNEVLVCCIELIDYDGVRLTSQNSGHRWPIVHPLGECEWRAVMMMMMMMPAGYNSWLVYQSSLAVLPAETSGANRRNWWRNENFVYSVPLLRQRIFNMP
jgi:hypothetical protein